MKRYYLIFFLVSLSWHVFAQLTDSEKMRRGQSFISDYTYDDSKFDGWKPAGKIKWSTNNNELIGQSMTGSSEGILMFQKDFQDIGINTLVKSSGAIEVGILFRIEPKGAGMKAIMAVVNGQNAGSYFVTLDKDGKILTRESLRAADGMIRFAPPANPDQQAIRPAQGIPAAGPELPNIRPEALFVDGEWNQLEFIFDVNLLRTYVNDGRVLGAGADQVNFGKFAFYVKGTGEVRFKNFNYKDLAIRFLPKEATSDRFEVQQISDMYYSWSASAGDFNNDGIVDVIAGPYIYYGPDYTLFREIYPAIALSPSKDFTDVNCQYVYDFNGDGWLDVFVGPPFGKLYLNPKGESRRWEEYSVIPGNINSEVTEFIDINGDGQPELIYGTNSNRVGVLKYAQFDKTNPTAPWKSFTVSESGYFMAHGIGAGDINGDGRMDILNPNGWWEQPETLSDEPWKYHPVAFGRYGHRIGGTGGSVMAVYDVNGDGLNDVVTVLNAHGFGLAWYEQKRDANNQISFVRHMIMDDYSTEEANAGGVTFSEPHGTTYADVDGDGIMDFIVGKRYFSHLDTYLDPDPFGPPVLYFYRTVRNPNAPGGAEFVPELIHNRSGAGSDVHAADLNQDGLMDIISSTNRGTFIFWNKSSK